MEVPGAEPCWTDLMTTDLNVAAQFYSNLFGWEINLNEEDIAEGYVDVFLDGKLVTGFVLNDPAVACTDVWSTYLNVADIQAASYSVKMHGGSIYRLFDF